MKKFYFLITFCLVAQFTFSQCYEASIDSIDACEGYIWTDGNSYDLSNFIAPTTTGKETPGLFAIGPNATWTNVYTACIKGDGNNGAKQTIIINVNSLPAGGANCRVVKSVANGNLFNGNAKALTLGVNKIEVGGVAFDRSVKLQFGSSDIEFSMLTLNGTSVFESTVQKLSSVAGCDSFVTLKLTFGDYSTSTIEKVSSCESYTWSNQITYTDSNYLTKSTIEKQTPGLFATGPNATWTNVYTACVKGDGNNGAKQTLEINVTDLPDGSTYRVVKTVANGNFNNGNAKTLTLGVNSIEVAAVTFDRTVKFQFSNNDIEFNMLSLNRSSVYDGKPKQVFKTTLGCDSILTLDLTLKNASSGTFTTSACDSFTWIDGNSYKKDNNTATYILQNTQGCDSTVTLDLKITDVNAGVTIVDELTLQAQAAESGTTYQWLNCDDLEPIIGDTNAIFIAKSSGDYAVDVTFNGCVKRSECYNIKSTVGLNGFLSNYKVQLYPNPTTDNLTILLEGITIVDVIISDIHGKVILKKSGLLDKDRISISSLESGIYFAKVMTPEFSKDIRVFKQ